MTVYYRTQGFIFKRTDLRETDQVFDIYTKDFGKLEVLGKAIRKIKSKLRAGTELFYLSEIEFIQGKTYKTLTDASRKEKFKNIRINLEKLETAFRISEILKKFLKFQEPDKKIWNLIITTFKELNDLSSSSSLSLSYYYFLWNFLSILGYQPELNNCVLCQENPPAGGKEGKFYFSSKEGGIVCQNCFKKEGLTLASQIDLRVLKILKILLKENTPSYLLQKVKGMDILRKIKITQEEKRELKTLSENFLSFSYNQ